MRAFITSDLSLTDNPRDEYRLQFLERLPALTTTQRIDRVYILGDLTEAKDRHPAYLVTRIVRGLAAIAHRRQVIVLQGNHDYLEQGWPFFAFLSEIANIKYIAEPTKSEGLLWLPHTRNWQEDWSIDMSGVRRILTHNTFAGAVGANGVQLGGIPLDALPDVPIISGDIHNPQRNGRLVYVGAPYTVDFGDEFEPRALILDDDKLLTLRLGGPQKRVVTIDSLDDIRNFFFAQVQANDRVRVQYRLAQSDAPLWPSIQQRIRELCAHEPFVLDSVVPLVNRKAAAAMLPAHQCAVATDEQILKDYCRRRDLDAKVEQQGVELL